MDSTSQPQTSPKSESPIEPKPGDVIQTTRFQNTDSAFKNYKDKVLGNAGTAGGNDFFVYGALGVFRVRRDGDHWLEVK